MAKHKGRAARKQQREKAAKAVDHGLPAPELAPKPQKTRRVGGDPVAAAVASEKAGRTGPARRAAPPTSTGMPVLAKVFIGAVVVLLIVYGLSQLRKSDSAPVSAGPAAASEDVAPSVAELLPAAPVDGKDSEAATAPMNQEEVISDGTTSPEPSAAQAPASKAPPSQTAVPASSPPPPASKAPLAAVRSVPPTAIKSPLPQATPQQASALAAPTVERTPAAVSTPASSATTPAVGAAEAPAPVSAAPPPTE
jgi:hypothetical protein